MSNSGLSDARARGGVVGNRVEAGGLATGNAMVERSAVLPIAAEPVDEAELEIGCEELAGVRVVGERTKTRAARYPCRRA